MSSSDVPSESAILLGTLIDMVKEQAGVLARWVRPYVIADVYPRWSVNMLYFRVRNVGQVPAYNIRLSVDQPITVLKQKANELNIFQRPIGVLGPGETISFFFGSALEVFDREDSILHFNVALQYKDPNDQNFDDVMPVDVDLLRGLSIELPATDKITETLERLQNDVRKIADYADHLKSKELIDQYRKSKKKTRATEAEVPSQDS